MTKDEALDLALEALEAHADIGIKSDKAITAIKQALAAPVSEPLQPVWNNLPSNKDVEDAMRIKRLNQLATPPAAQRQWVGLTAAEQRSIEKKHIFVEDAIRLTEAKLKELNT